MPARIAKWTGSLIVLALLAGLAYLLYIRLVETTGPAAAVRPASTGPVPVMVAAVEVGPIEDRRVFSGTLEAPASFTVAPKLGGRLEWMDVQIGDPVTRGQIIARIDDDEYTQDVAQAEAALAVSNANHAESLTGFEIAQRKYDRTRTLSDRGVASDSQLDLVEADLAAQKAAVDVAEATVRRSQSALESARIRLAYTQVIASWPEGDDQRVVSERHVDPGNTISANTPLVTVIETDPLLGIVYVTERDYGRMSVEQPATLSTDAHAGKTFPAAVIRFAPVFRAASRQARVELSVPNAEGLLKPGMFIRCDVVLGRIDRATIVPTDAIIHREDRDWVFVVDPSGKSVRMTPVELGIRDRRRVQVIGPGVEGRVVILGQQLLADGSAVVIPDDPGSAAPAAPPRQPLADEAESQEKAG